MAQDYRASIRGRYRVLRASLSLPSMLSQLDENRVVMVLAAINGGFAVLVISLLAWLTGLPMLFPSLGATTFILFTRPFSVAACPRSVILSHLSGIVCGWAGWALLSHVTGDPVSLEHPDLALCLSANVGFALTAALLLILSAPHPPACATALIVATGAMAHWADLLVMAAAVLALALQGVIIYRLLGVYAPLWRIDPHHAKAGGSAQY